LIVNPYLRPRPVSDEINAKRRLRHIDGGCLSY
jgi:hypothetical protein